MSGARAPLCEAAPVRLGVAAPATTEALLADLGSRGTSLEVEEVREGEGGAADLFRIRRDTSSMDCS